MLVKLFAKDMILFNQIVKNDILKELFINLVINFLKTLLEYFFGNNNGEQLKIRIIKIVQDEGMLSISLDKATKNIINDTSVSVSILKMIFLFMFN